MPRTPAQCGTRSGYYRHLRLGEQSCAECLQAHREYQSGLRERRPDFLTRQTRQAMLRRRALAALADRHPEEYQAIYRDVVADAHREEASA